MRAFYVIEYGNMGYDMENHTFTHADDYWTRYPNEESAEEVLEGLMKFVLIHKLFPEDSWIKIQKYYINE